MTAREKVLAVYPSAYAFESGDGWKIYSVINGTFNLNAATHVGISATMPSEADAWADSAKRIEERKNRDGI